MRPPKSLKWLLRVVRAVYKARGALAIELLGAGSFDDMQWWSLAYANAGLLLSNREMVASAAAVFDHVWAHAYDNTSCGGGVWWSSRRSYKNAVTNELALANAATLHRATNESRYLALAKAQWAWFNSSGPAVPLVASVSWGGGEGRGGGAAPLPDSSQMRLSVELQKLGASRPATE